MIWVLGGLGVIVAGFAAYVRLAPVDVARWDVVVLTDATPDCTLRQGSGDARLACLRPGTPAHVLAQLDSIAVATPRTRRLAGSAETGRITWITRSALWGFPDYTTAEAQPQGDQTRLDLYARQGIGSNDWGVNAARLTDWMAQLER